MCVCQHDPTVSLGCFGWRRPACQATSFRRQTVLLVGLAVLRECSELLKMSTWNVMVGLNQSSSYELSERFW